MQEAWCPGKLLIAQQVSVSGFTAQGSGRRTCLRLWFDAAGMPFRYRDRARGFVRLINYSLPDETGRGSFYVSLSASSFPDLDCWTGA